jgi:hypothetical protein
VFNFLYLFFLLPDLHHHLSLLLHILNLAELILVFQVFHLVADLFHFLGQSVNDAIELVFLPHLVHVNDLNLPVKILLCGLHLCVVGQGLLGLLHLVEVG